MTLIAHPSRFRQAPGAAPSAYVTATTQRWASRTHRPFRLSYQATPARRRAHTHMHALTCIRSHACAHMHALTCMHSHACAHMHPLTCIRSHACAHMHPLTCMHSHACAHMHPLTCTHAAPCAASARPSAPSPSFFMRPPASCGLAWRGYIQLDLTQSDDMLVTSLHPYIHSPIHAFTHSSIHPYTHTSIHPFTHTSIQTDTPTHTHTCSRKTR